jgi:hypothetical protein
MSDIRRPPGCWRGSVPPPLLPLLPASRLLSTSTQFALPSSLRCSDDFYQLSSGLAVIETTIGNNNNTLYELYMVRPFVRPFVRSCSCSL